MAGYGFPPTATPGYTLTTPGDVYGVPYNYTEYTEYYVPTPPQNRGRRRPVIYIAAPLPAGPVATPYGNTGFPGGMATPYGGASGFPTF